MKPKPKIKVTITMPNEKVYQFVWDGTQFDWNDIRRALKNPDKLLPYGGDINGRS